MADTITSLVACPCCGETVTLTAGGFATTTAEIEACSFRRAEGVVSYTIRKSEALALRPVARCADCGRGLGFRADGGACTDFSHTGVAHRDGLVVLGG